MRKTPVLLAILLLLLGVVLCAFSATVAFAIFQVIRSVNDLELLRTLEALRTMKAAPVMLALVTKMR
jgi:hypothetical protein